MAHPVKSQNVRITWTCNNHTGFQAPLQIFWFSGWMYRPEICILQVSRLFWAMNAVDHGVWEADFIISWALRPPRCAVGRHCLLRGVCVCVCAEHLAWNLAYGRCLETLAPFPLDIVHSTISSSHVRSLPEKRPNSPVCAANWQKSADTTKEHQAFKGEKSLWNTSDLFWRI